MYFSSSTTRSITYTPTVATVLYYYSYVNTETSKLNPDHTTADPHRDLQRYTRTHMGAHVVVNRDDSGTFQLPTDVPLTAKDAATPRFLSACFIPAGAIQE